MTVPDEEVQGRFDIYGPPHKGIRHAHGAMLTDLSRADFSQPQGELLGRLRMHLKATARHLDEENRFIHPLLEERAPHATSRLVTQHDEHEAYFGRLEALMAAVEAADGAEAVAAGRDLFLTFTQLVGMDLGHMDEEEQATWPLLCAHLTDEEMQGIVGQVLQDYPEEMLTYFMGHMAAAITEPELAETVAGLKASMPPEVFAKLFADAFEPRLDDGRRARLAEMDLLPA